MNEVIRNIYKSVSVRLSVSILTFVVVIFAVTMTILIHRSKASVRQAAIEESGQMLTNTAQRLTGIMDEVEVATLNTYWQVFQQLQPDSLLALSARILELNPMLNGCSIAMEPNFFPSEGRYFSAYSFNNDGYIDHVSLYIGNGTCIHASNSRMGVITTAWPMGSVVTIRRFV